MKGKKTAQVTYTIELSEDEAKALYAIVGNIDWSQPDTRIGGLAEAIGMWLDDVNAAAENVGDPVINPNSGYPIVMIEGYQP